MTDRLALLEQRMSVLERRNRSLAAVTLIALVVAGTPYLLGAQQPAGDVVRAGRFEVTQNGRAVVALGANADGGIFQLFDAGRAEPGAATAARMSVDVNAGMIETFSVNSPGTAYMTTSAAGGVFGLTFNGLPSGSFFGSDDDSVLCLSTARITAQCKVRLAAEGITGSLEVLNGQNVPILRAP